MATENRRNINRDANFTLAQKRIIKDVLTDAENAAASAAVASAAATAAQATADAILSGLPTSDPGVAGEIWNNSGVLTVSAGP